MPRKKKKNVVLSGYAETMENKPRSIWSLVFWFVLGVLAVAALWWLFFRQ